MRETVNPIYINLQSKGGLGWLEGFNEFVARCGLEWSGHPGTDKFINNVGDPATMELTLHGRVENLPASEVEVVIDRERRIAFTFEGAWMSGRSMGRSSNCGRTFQLSRDRAHFALKTS